MHALIRALAALVLVAALVVSFPSTGFGARAARRPLFTSNGCTVVQPTVAFPNYNPLTGGDSTFTGSISVTCTLPTELNIALGTGTSGTFTQRKMQNGASAIGYNLYVSNGGAVFGDGTGGTQTENIFSFLTAGTGTIYGDVPASQAVPAGTYTDTVPITVTFVF